MKLVANTEAPDAHGVARCRLPPLDAQVGPSGYAGERHLPVGEARLTGSEMRWKRTHVNLVRALRTGVCNERWQDTWQGACHRRQLALCAHRQPRTPCMKLSHEQVGVAPPPGPLLPPDPSATRIIPGNAVRAPQRSVHPCEKKREKISQSPRHFQMLLHDACGLR